PVMKTHGVISVDATKDTPTLVRMVSYEVQWLRIDLMKEDLDFMTDAQDMITGAKCWFL
ncbi:hypothetical protein Tco_1486731, partial [Tanacetum coccineum]